MKLFFCQNDYPIRGEFWQKNSFITHILFELCLFWYLAQSTYLWDTLYICADIRSVTSEFAQLCFQISRFNSFESNVNIFLFSYCKNGRSKKPITEPFESIFLIFSQFSDLSELSYFCADCSEWTTADWFQIILQISKLKDFGVKIWRINSEAKVNKSDETRLQTNFIPGFTMNTIKNILLNIAKIEVLEWNSYVLEVILDKAKQEF